MSIPFEELEGSPRFEVRDDETVAVRTFMVPWTLWPKFGRQLLGQYEIRGGQYHFVPPTGLDGFPHLLVSELIVEPLDPRSPSGAVPLTTVGRGTNDYTWGAKVTAIYRTRFDEQNASRTKLPTVPQGTYLTFRADVAAEYAATPGRTWRWNAPPDYPAVAPDVQPGLLRPQSLFHLTWHRVPMPPWDAMRALRGKVNASEFVGSPPGTVLFLGAKVRREFLFLASDPFWRVEYAFQENVKELETGGKVGWNHWYRETAVSGEHWVAIADEDGNPPYASADFSPLFSFGT
jgi:hypothetical protein